MSSPSLSPVSSSSSNDFQESPSTPIIMESMKDLDAEVIQLSSDSERTSDDDPCPIEEEMKKLQASLEGLRNKIRKRRRNNSNESKSRKRLREEVSSSESGSTSRNSEGDGETEKERELKMELERALEREKELTNKLENATDKVRDLTEKLKMVTQQLIQSRGELAKKRRRRTAQEPVVIEIPDFPMELYDKKVKFDKDSEDLEEYHRRRWSHSAVTKNLEYRTWIGDRVTSFLPQVLKIMVNKWTSPHQISGRDLLNCRLVSKTWKNSVDKILREDAQSSDSGFKTMSKPLVASRLSTKKKTKYLEQIEAMTRANFPPFPSQSLVVKLSHPGTPVEHSNSLMLRLVNLLLNCGKDLKHLTFIPGLDKDAFFDHDRIKLRCWNTLQYLLFRERLSNLESFELKLKTSKKTQDLKAAEAIRDFPCPKWAKLTSAKLVQVPGVFLKSLLSHNPQLERLSVTPAESEEHVEWIDYKELGNNLGHLSLNFSKTGHVLFLKQVPWSLRSLTLTRSSGLQEPLEMGQLFDVLNAFKTTLFKLSLNLRITNVKTPPPLHLARLEHLKLDLQEVAEFDKISYDFMTPLAALKSLNIAMKEESDAREGEGSEEIVQMRGFLHRFYDSNTWQIFPELETVTATTFRTGKKDARVFQYSRHRLPRN